MRIRDDVEYDKKRRQIMDAALEVFAEKGFERATGGDIAQRAGIGTGALLYHYFKDKASLLQEAVQARSPSLQAWGSEESLMGMTPREALTALASAMLAQLGDASSVALFRVMLSEALRWPAVAEVWSASFSGRTFESLSRYLAAQMEAGVLRQMDVGAAVYCFVGPLFMYAMTSEILPVEAAYSPSPENLASAAVEVFLQGLAI